MEHAEVQQMIEAAMDRYENNVAGIRHRENLSKFDELMSLTRNNGTETIKLQTQMEALYGNGSGRKGAIERMDEKIDQVLLDVAKHKGQETASDKYRSVIMWVLGGLGTLALTIIVEVLKK